MVRRLAGLGRRRMMSGVLFARLVSGRLTVTLMVLSLGAVWLVPAATFTVILAVPALSR